MTEYPIMICKTGHINEINAYDRRPIISQKVTGVFILHLQTCYYRYDNRYVKGYKRNPLNNSLKTS